MLVPMLIGAMLIVSLLAYLLHVVIMTVNQGLFMYMGCDKEEIQTLFNNFMNDFNFIKDFVKDNDNAAYQNWKLGGFIVDENMFSMYKNATEAFDAAMANFETEEGEDE